MSDHKYVSFDLSDDGRTVILSAADRRLYLLTLETNQVSQLTQGGGVDTCPRFSPLGGSAVFARSTDHERFSLYLVGLADGELRRLTDSPDANDFKPTWSSDGKRIAFARAHRRRPYSMGGYTWDHWDVYELEVESGKLTRLTSQNYGQLWSLTYTPGAFDVLFSVDPGPKAYFLQREGLALHPFPRNEGQSFPKRAWEVRAATKQSILIVKSDDASAYSYDFYVHEWPQGMGKRLGAVAIASCNENPVATPDGRELLFLSGTRSQLGTSRPILSLWKISLDDGKAVQLADSKLFDDPLNWKPE